ncbi:Gfo/Idh/MocA family protein [Paenibacillus agricola]|uniref:Gfo/Idh/MocA family oxidoreductase n=1 Tax=Paenibacillus agricola TaxID=2716264 RepID=A0ABX0JCW5_9BACL|nr:Gfo/Idh/MocA family oxidoreductase [Paenibacillus agricola]NHN33091.1 Gfo/Idh/MocA family oxidoreductase [Paenibacillus agricola]
MKIIRAALIGVGGFGKIHVRHFLELSALGQLEITAFSDINPDVNKEGWERLLASGGTPYTDYRTMLDSHPELDLVVIASPIPMHKEMAIEVFKRGIHVLLEKPPAVTIQDLDEMLNAQKGTTSLCQVDFQNTSGGAFRKLLDTIHSGQIGDVLHVTGTGLWKRTQAYYNRTGWAGKLVFKGNYVLDGTINNPLAHLLNNCLLAAGGGVVEQGKPLNVQAELYHANPIEGDDTSCLRIYTQSGAIVHFYASLCNEKEETPGITVKGTLGELIWKYDNTLDIRIGSEHSLHTSPTEDYVRNMYLNLFAAIRDQNVALYSSLEMCRNFVLAVNGAFESSQETHQIAEPHLTKTDESSTTFTGIKDIKNTIAEAAAKGLLFSELDVPWAIASKPFELEGYSEFKLFAPASS